MNKINKILKASLAFLICFSLAGCMNKKVKTITVVSDNPTADLKDSNSKEEFNDTEALMKSVREFKWKLYYSEKSQKLEKTTLSFILDINQYMDEVKKSKEYEKIKKAGPEYVKEFEKEILSNFNTKNIKDAFEANEVKEISSKKYEVVILVEDFDGLPEKIQKIKDLDDTKKAVHKEVKRTFDLSKKDYKLEIKNY